MDLAEVVGQLADLRRFPVEPLSGESPNEVALKGECLVGDGAFIVCDQSGKPIAPDSASYLLRCSARLVDATVEERFSALTRVQLPEGAEHALLDPAWLERAAHEVGRALTIRSRGELGTGSPRIRLLTRSTLGFVERAYGGPLEEARQRAHLLVDLHVSRPFEENAWVGRKIHIGDALFEVAGPSRGSVLAADLGPDASRGDVTMLDGVLHVRGGTLGVELRPLAGSRLRVGDPIALSD